MKPIVISRNTEGPFVAGTQARVDSTIRGVPILRRIPELDEFLVAALHRWSIPALRVALGLVFIWFGALKTLGVSPVVEIIQQSYSLLPLHPLVLILGGWEILIGTGLILKRALRCTLILLCIHLAGTFLALCLAPRQFFLHGLPLLLTVDGEFVIKNVVLIAAGLVIGGYEIKPLRTKGPRRISERLLN
jgi:putative oxidoreductase